ncbi:MAG: methyltransferase domain-containing protein [Solirubrobacterales bacterium]|nr:methyltransferase domain-containing protein [Solirubrobacterales bacterium]
MSVVWHDLECGSYHEDLELWRELARRHGDPVLEIGAGTGRVSLELARRGHRVVALDHDPVLLAELRRRAGRLALSGVLADAREFELGRRFALCLVPMQTIQLLTGASGRAGFLRCARAHLERGGLLAAAISEQLETYEVLDGSPAPVPDICERDGVLYSSLPTAVRAEPGGYTLARRRETVSPGGSLSVQEDRIHLDRLTAAELEREAGSQGFHPVGRASVPATADYAGSTVVMLRA